MLPSMHWNICRTSQIRHWGTILLRALFKEQRLAEVVMSFDTKTFVDHPLYCKFELLHFRSLDMPDAA